MNGPISVHVRDVLMTAFMESVVALIKQRLLYRKKTLYKNPRPHGVIGLFLLFDMCSRFCLGSVFMSVVRFLLGRLPMDGSGILSHGTTGYTEKSRLYGVEK